MQSLETYSRCADFLRQFCRESRDLTGLIIGAVSDSEPLLSPQAQGTTADTWYWQGVDYAERCPGRRQELLSATPDTLLALADALENGIAGRHLCGRRASPSWKPAGWTASRAFERLRRKT